MIIYRSSWFEKKIIELDGFSEYIQFNKIVRWYFFGIPIWTYKSIEKHNIK